MGLVRGADPDDPTRCICCDLPLESCGAAIADRHAEEARARARRRAGIEKEAEYPGICVGCNTHFSAGSLIEYDPDAEGWRSLSCCP